MGFRDRMKKTKADRSLRRRHNRGETKTGQKDRFPTVIIKSKLPEGRETWWCKEGKHIADILPWYAGPNFPLDSEMNPVAEEGKMVYKLELFVHRNVGNGNKPYVCPYENFGKPCPICDFLRANKLEKDDWKELVSKTRVFYLVWVHDENDPDAEKKGVQLWEVAAFFMEEKLEEIAALPRGGGFESFWHPDKGKSVAWTRKGTKNTEYLGHRFIPREAPIPDRILDQTFPIDTVINMHPSYEEIEKDFKGTLKRMKLLDMDGEDGDETPFNEEGVGEMPDWNEDEEKPVRKRRRKKPTDRKRTSGSTSKPRTRVRKRRKA